MFPADLFVELEARTRALLSAHGYQCTKSELAGPFGSMFAEYRSPQSLITLVWDGKEGWLTLSESSPSANQSTSTRELYFERFPGLAVRRAAYEAAVEHLLGALSKRLLNVA